MTAIPNYNDKGSTICRWYIFAVSEIEIHKRFTS